MHVLRGAVTSIVCISQILASHDGRAGGECVWDGSVRHVQVELVSKVVRVAQHDEVCAVGAAVRAAVP